MNNKELIEKIEEMDSNKDIMLEKLVEETNEYFKNIDINKKNSELLRFPYEILNINNETYFISFVNNTEVVFLDYKKSKHMEIFEIYKHMGIFEAPEFTTYAGRDVYKFKNDGENLYCQLEEVEPIQKTIIDWRYK